MARRQISQREVTNVVPYQSGDMAGAIGGLIDQATGTYKEFKQKQDTIKMNEYLADSDIALTKATREWQAKNEADPMNPDSIKSLHANYDKILSSYDSGISVVSRGKWTNAKNALKYQHGKSVAKWSMDQAVVNAVDSIESALEKNTDLAVEQGRVFDEEGRQRSFERMVATLKASSGQIGTHKIEKTIDLHRSDQLKSYTLGMIESDPDRAERLLNMKEFRKDIGSEEAVGVLRDVVTKQRKVNAQRAKREREENNLKIANDLVDNVNSHGLGELKRMHVLKQLEDKDHKRLVNFKTKTVYADKFDPVSYNDIVTKINSSMTDGEVMNEIVDNAGNLTETDTKALTKMLQERRGQKVKTTHDREFDGLKAVFQRVYSDVDRKAKKKGNDVPKVHKAIIDEVLYNFNKEVSENNYNSEQIKEAAKEYKIKLFQKIDPTFEYTDEKADLNKLGLFYPGTEVMNPETGEKSFLDKYGKWIMIGQGLLPYKGQE